MRRCVIHRHKMPKNLHVAPRFDIWHEKYEPWSHLKRMGKLVGTGFYIPPEWYNQFRMFPPIHGNYKEEQTLNPHNRSEPTQDGHLASSEERRNLRDELSRKSRSVAAEGMRYYNLFWMRKPLDEMERQYYQCIRDGLTHDAAIKTVLRRFYETLSVKKRISAIQSEEAKLSGQFITMREAATVLGVLSQLQSEQLTPQQAATLATSQRRRVHEGGIYVASVEQREKLPTPAPTVPSSESTVASATDQATAPPATAEVAAAPKVDEGTMTAEVLMLQLEDDADHVMKIQPQKGDTLASLREKSTDGTAEMDWFAQAHDDASRANISVRSPNPKPKQ